MIHARVAATKKLAFRTGVIAPPQPERVYLRIAPQSASDAAEKRDARSRTPASVMKERGAMIMLKRRVVGLGVLARIARMH
jgi:hypothetical protein